MVKTYHDQILDIFCENLSLFHERIGFIPSLIEKKIDVGIRGHLLGEIDISLKDRVGNVALVEVKSNKDDIWFFREKQFYVYRAFNPEAHIFLLRGNNSHSLNPLDFNFRRYWPAI